MDYDVESSDGEVGDAVQVESPQGEVEVVVQVESSHGGKLTMSYMWISKQDSDISSAFQNCLVIISISNVSETAPSL
jgi:hypothetical protein